MPGRFALRRDSATRTPDLLSHRSYARRAAGGYRHTHGPGRGSAPAMIGAGKRASVAAFRRADGRTTMCTAVEEGRDGVVRAAHQDDRLGADLARNKVPRLGDFTLVTNKHPAVVENFFQLIAKDMRVGVQRPMDPFALDKGVVLDRINGSLLHRMSPRPDYHLLYRLVSEPVAC